MVVTGLRPVSGSAWSRDGVRTTCFAEHPGAASFTVDGLSVPGSMVRFEAHGGNGEVEVPSAESNRDADGNILLYFGGGGLPTDLSRCWMYFARDRLWVSSG